MLWYYLKNPKRTGALCSSSKKLSFAITEKIGIEEAQNIIEIGPGMGAFTKMILNKKKENASFFAVEINASMAENLKKKISGLDVEVGSAEFLDEMMKKRQMDQADAIVSGIPWALLGAKEQNRILESIYNSLKEGGYFTTFAYILPTLPARRFRKRIFEIFGEVKTSKIVWQNIPPAFVYYCKK